MLTLRDLLSPQNLQDSLHFYRNDLTHWNRATDNRTFQKKTFLYVMQLVRDIEQGRYQVEPLRRVSIPKSSGGVRRIAELALQDKFIQRAFLQLFSPLVEGMFHKHSFAFRTGRNCDMAVNLVNKQLSEGYVWIIHADVKNCFDCIQLKPLYRQICQLVSDKNLQNLIYSWLFSHATEPCWLTSKARGIPQGSVLAPVMCNLYLHQVDAALDNHGILFCRYADDLLIQAKTEAASNKAFALLQKRLNRHGLSLNSDKLFMGKVAAGHRFLGKSLEPC